MTEARTYPADAILSLPERLGATLVEELHRAIFPPVAKAYGRWVLILQAYFGESGTRQDGPALILAGLLSTAEKWEALADEWKKLTDKWGIPFFHMNGFENKTGVYQQWETDGVREERLNLLLDLICKYAAARVSIAVPTKTFKEVYGVAATSNLKFAVAARALFEHVSIFDGTGEITSFYPMTGAEADRIAFFFEAGAEGIGNVQKLFNIYYRRPITRSVFKLLSFTLGGKQDYVPLQAADITAYESYRHWIWQFESDQTRPHRYPWVKLASVRGATKQVNRDMMELWKPDLLQAVP